MTEVLEADANLREIARLTSELAGVRDVLAQRDRALVAERAARSRYEIIVLAARRLRTAVETLNGIGQAETALWAALSADNQETKASGE